MTVKKVGGKRNFGFGRSLWYAMRTAIADRYGGGRFGSWHAVRARLRLFAAFLKILGIRDLQDITIETVELYATYLRRRVATGEIRVSTAVNRVSAVNILMEHVRGDNECWISPSHHVGRRTFVRKTVPPALDKERVKEAVVALCDSSELRLAAVIMLCFFLGLRFREASLLVAKPALRQARRHGVVEIKRGAKGGRKRTIKVGQEQISVLEFTLRACEGGKCLVPQDCTYARWCRRSYRVWQRHAGKSGLTTKFSDMRASFACRIYEEESGVSAPVVTGGRTISRLVDRDARRRVSKALGHARGQIAGAYVGTTIRASRS